jgi:hypothetical protein
MKKLIMGLCLVLMIAMSGCWSGTSIITHTGTVLGVELDYKAESSLPFGRVGYVRDELAIVPTNKTREGEDGTATIGGGAKDCPNVLIEFSMANIFNIFTTHLIYQRIAIGDIAVTQPGAVAMLVKDADGNIDPEVLRIALAIAKIKSTPQATLKAKEALTDIYLYRDDLSSKILELLKGKGIDSWDEFIDDKTLDANDINKIIKEVQ